MCVRELSKEKERERSEGLFIQVSPGNRCLNDLPNASSLLSLFRALGFSLALSLYIFFSKLNFLKQKFSFLFSLYLMCAGFEPMSWICQPLQPPWAAVVNNFQNNPTTLELDVANQVTTLTKQSSLFQQWNMFKTSAPCLSFIFLTIDLLYPILFCFFVFPLSLFKGFLEIVGLSD